MKKNLIAAFAAVAIVFGMFGASASAQVQLQVSPQQQQQQSYYRQQQRDRMIAEAMHVFGNVFRPRRPAHRSAVPTRRGTERIGCWSHPGTVLVWHVGGGYLCERPGPTLEVLGTIGDGQVVYAYIQ